MLLNVGFAEAMMDFNSTCVIFHDIDLLPMNETNLYNCPAALPLHMSARVSTWGFKVPYPTIFGGVTAFTPEQFAANLIIVTYIFCLITRLAINEKSPFLNFFFFFTVMNCKPQRKQQLSCFFERVNGYSNMFWGWGAEDDDMYNRS